MFHICIYKDGKEMMIPYREVHCMWIVKVLQSVALGFVNFPVLHDRGKSIQPKASQELKIYRSSVVYLFYSFPAVAVCDFNIVEGFVRQVNVFLSILKHLS